VARVEADLATYYNYDFRNQEHRFQSINLHNEDHQLLHGYVERQSKVYDELMDILSDGNAHRITLKIIQTTNQTDMPLIIEVLSRTWIYSQPEESA
jgi:hypothetical protein